MAAIQPRGKELLDGPTVEFDKEVVESWDAGECRLSVLFQVRYRTLGRRECSTFCFVYQANNQKFIRRKEWWPFRGPENQITYDSRNERT
jgi:hypothetical protein